MPCTRVSPLDTLEEENKGKKRKRRKIVWVWKMNEKKHNSLQVSPYNLCKCGIRMITMKKKARDR